MILPLSYSLGMEREEMPLVAGIGFAFHPAGTLGLPASASLLHANEQRFLGGLRYPLRQANFILGRMAAKAAFHVCYPSVSPVEIDLAHGVFGQPLVRGAVPGAEVSLAHSKGAAVGIVGPGGHPVGVDLEWLDIDRVSTVEQDLDDQEKATWEATALAPIEASFACWSMREALAKVLRCGLTIPLRLLAVNEVREDRDGWVGTFLNFPQYQAKAWIVGGFALALVFPRRSTVRFSPPPGVHQALAAAARQSPAPAVSPANG